MRWRYFFLIGMLASGNALAADWLFLGVSEAGEHYVDMDSMQWSAESPAFLIVTKVIMPDSTGWTTRLHIDCKRNRFSYMSGAKTRNGELLSRFDQPRPAQPITADSMPHRLKDSYCALAPAPAVRWVSIGRSKVAEVFYDPASIRSTEAGQGFVADTRVVPFAQDEQTFSRLQFNCSDGTFTLLRLSKLRAGEQQIVFDAPQPPAPTSRTATLAKLAARYCNAPLAKKP